MSWQSNLRPKKIYIIPTRMGAIFIFSALIIIILGFGYTNNLINLLGFFMLSLVFVSMILTNLQLKHLELEKIEVDQAYANGEIIFHLFFKNQSSTDLFGIKVSLPELNNAFSPSTSTIFSQGLTPIKISTPAELRGMHSINKLQVSTVFPMGLFYSWKLFSSPKSFIIYPESIGIAPLPLAENLGSSNENIPTSKKAGGDDFYGHRSFNSGDSARHIDWKAYARHGNYLIKEFNDDEQASLSLDYQNLNHLTPEARLSQLTAWIQQCLREGIEFQLKIPGLTIPFGRGEAHANLCLEKLALFPKEFHE